MAHQALHRVTVRMLFDPAFARAVAERPEQALAGLGLSAQERAWLAAVDPRAWTLDPQRRARSLKALFDELPASTTLALGELRSRAALDAYFQSPEFHAAMQDRGSMTLAYADWLAGRGLRTPLLPEVLRLERGLACCRRELEATPARLASPPAGPWVARAPGVGAGTFDGATLEAIAVTERWLFAASLLPPLALAQDAPGLGPLPAPQGPTLHLVLQPTAGGSGLLELGRAVTEALALAESPLPTPRWIKHVGALGLGRERAARLLGDLREEGLVVGPG